MNTLIMPISRAGATFIFGIALLSITHPASAGPTKAPSNPDCSPPVSRLTETLLHYYCLLSLIPTPPLTARSTGTAPFPAPTPIENPWK